MPAATDLPSMLEHDGLPVAAAHPQRHWQRRCHAHPELDASRSAPSSTDALNIAASQRNEINLSIYFVFKSFLPR